MPVRTLCDVEDKRVSGLDKILDYITCNVDGRFGASALFSTECLQFLINVPIATKFDGDKPLSAKELADFMTLNKSKLEVYENVVKKCGLDSVYHCETESGEGILRIALMNDNSSHRLKRIAAKINGEVGGMGRVVSLHTRKDTQPLAKVEALVHIAQKACAEHPDLKYVSYMQQIVVTVELKDVAVKYVPFPELCHVVKKNTDYIKEHISVFEHFSFLKAAVIPLDHLLTQGVRGVHVVRVCLLMESGLVDKISAVVEKI